MATVYEREIESLHAFFEAWYQARCPPERFARLETALAPSFERVSPTGTIQDRETVLASVEGARGDRTGDFAIEIEAVEQIDRTPRRALVRYVERQTPGDDRLSTVLFGLPSGSADERTDAATHGPAGTDEPPAPTGLVWLSLQETWL